MRVAQEIRACTRIGCRVGLVHLQVNSNNSIVSPDVQVCVKENLAEVVLPETPVHAKLAIVHSPSSVTPSVQKIDYLSADKVVLVVDRKPDPAQLGQWLSFHFGPVSWAPTNRWVRAGLVALNAAIPLEEEDWRPTGMPLSPVTRALKFSQKPVFGRVSVSGAAQWPTTKKELIQTYPIGNGNDFRIMGPPLAKLLKELGSPAGLKVYSQRDITVERFLEMLDVFMYFPSKPTPTLPEAAIATAMASGKLVILPPHLEGHFGQGAIYSEHSMAKETIFSILNDDDAVDVAKKNAKHHAKFQFTEQNYSQKISSLLEDHKPRTKRKRKESTSKRVLFVPSNGVGLGHVTRQLAIARQLKNSLEPVFATFAQAAPIIEGFGYPTEYIPSQSDTGTEHGQWDSWMRYELGSVIDRYDPNVVVFDGNNPSSGLINAVLSRRRRGLVWVRRGMIGSTPSRYLGNSRYMDLIIEPGEIAGELDVGSTVDRKHEALQVDPITLLDRDEILPREAARKALGLSPEGKTVIIQLGGNATRDVVSLTGEIIDLLKGFPTLQIVLVEWENSSVEFPNWPSVKILRGFPISRYFNAFDFSISAAGYNSFHEVMAFGLPSVFIANRHPSMDNQAARAEFAQQHSAGFDLSQEELFHLPTICEILMTDQATALFRDEAKKLYLSNGAKTAAAAITELAERI
ncbi:glycosyltransferase [Falsihalocynthiibacter sp. CO-5D18]|uniref:glycosyltransferase n=1 Tax=Falsihalocynthiibacter sp. CO-5D18 TaxID=3240872 RepID=UPI00350F7E2E